MRYDVDLNLMDENNFELNATRQVLEAIGSPYAAFPKTPKLDISPRVGFAYDLSGDGRRVLRGGYGLYFDQYNTAAAAGDITAQARRPLNALATLTNTAIGVGQLATYRFGIDPLPPQPTEGNKLPLGAQGQWIDPDMTDPRTHQAHVGYAHELIANTTLAVDYTHVEGRNEKRQLNINPIINGRRRLADDFQRVYGVANYLSERQNPVGYQQVAVRRADVPLPAPHAAHDGAGALHAGGLVLVRRVHRQSLRRRAAAGVGSAVCRERMGPERSGRTAPVRVHRRHRGAVRCAAVTDRPVGERPGLQPDRGLGPQRGRQQQRPMDRSRDRSAGLAQLGARRQHVRLRLANDEVHSSLEGTRRLGIFVEAFNLFNTVNFGNAYQGNGRSATFQTTERVHTEHRYPAAGAVGGSLPLLARLRLASGSVFCPRSARARVQSRGAR